MAQAGGKRAIRWAKFQCFQVKVDDVDCISMRSLSYFSEWGQEDKGRNWDERGTKSHLLLINIMKIFFVETQM